MSTSLVAPPPSVKVGGKPYQVRFGQGAFYLLGTWGIDVSRIVEVHNEMIGSGRGREYAMKIAAASLGNYDANGVWRSLGAGPLDVADMLLDGEWEALDSTAWEAFKKKAGLVVIPATAPSLSTKSDGSDSGPSEPEQARGSQ